MRPRESESGNRAGLAEYHYELMRPGQILAARESAGIAYVPLGPLEWHGRHLPFGVDGLTATAVADRAVRRTGGVLLPTFYFGTERDRPPERLALLGFEPQDYVVGMDFPGFDLKSLYVDESVFGLLVHAIILALSRQHWPLVVVVNGHGALNHRAALERIVRAWNEESGSSTKAVSFFIFPKESPSGLLTDHAAALETSLVMAIHKQSVDLSELPAAPEPLAYRDHGIVEGQTWAGNPTPDFTVRAEADPRLASTEQKGEEQLAFAAASLVTLVRTYTKASH